MPEYVIAYQPDPAKMSSQDPEEGAKGKEAFGAWLAGLGDAVVNPGTPLGPRKTVTTEAVSDGGLENLMGFSILKADDMDAALEMAKTCPFLSMGAVVVAEAMQM